MAKSFIIRRAESDYHDVCDFLIAECGYMDLAHLRSDHSIKSRWSVTLGALADIPYVIENLQQIRDANVLFCVGYITLFVRLLVWSGIIHCRRLYWYSFFLHSPKWFPAFRMLLRVGRTECERFVVFSEHELHLYQHALHLPVSVLCYFPYGHWHTYSVETLSMCQKGTQGSYYFAGGASNRDYLSLIDVFQSLPQQLIIVCSSVRNRDVLRVALPPNVTVMVDLESAEFDDFVCRSKACILPLKHDTGASGQSVILRYMGFGKAIIASNTAVVREYIHDGRSGLLLSDIRTELADAISLLESDEGLRIRLGGAARRYYCDHFSREAMARTLKQLDVQ